MPRYHIWGWHFLNPITCSATVLDIFMYIYLYIYKFYIYIYKQILICLLISVFNDVFKRQGNGSKTERCKSSLSLACTLYWLFSFFQKSLKNRWYFKSNLNCNYQSLIMKKGVIKKRLKNKTKF